ncbi:HisA/HisF-related TIM barrel protein [Actinotignum urinale]|uniref:1-(5-phosphoribosyl)-5-[(5-phosphoribosylamino)methylideneamino] imidazole-4-carboxamide isomerase n=1 Tax=Actinotignum urinale TaxID=190146 RepID=A0ABU5G7N9_9ACTO|nr:HisA/HisF-related TIM barrel protein [Actinotignum urinale]MDY5133353.1 HisA/HisF-related TIM barrel protein [Actinotignum urinale]
MDTTTTFPPLQLLPAVDVHQGKAVRLTRGAIDGGNFGQAADVVREFLDLGATWVHLVDLDAAFQRGYNTELLAQIVAEVDISVELSGGIRNFADVKRSVDAGARRVVLSAATLSDPHGIRKILDTYGPMIAVGIDINGDEIIARGSGEHVGNVWELLDSGLLEGAGHLVVTDTIRDGALAGAALDVLTRVSSQTDIPLTASGGIASLEDIRELRGLSPKVDSVIIGKAFYVGQINFVDALRVAGPQH